MGITTKDIFETYTLVYKFIIDMNITELPTPLEYICEQMGVELVPLSEILKKSNLNEKEVFECWGNKDGALSIYKSNANYKFKIGYNDKLFHRSRFTIAEEIMHIVLKHYRYKNYYPNLNVIWNESRYQSHDECARIGAGMLLCPAPVFLQVPGILNVSDIQYLCDISWDCAEVRYKTMHRFKLEMKNHYLYKNVVEQYKDYINENICSHCGKSFKCEGYSVCPNCITRQTYSIM